ncbi:MAG TPA: fructose-6-phosphate aldolase [Thermodesulfobacteriota bacterium]
MKIFIDSANLDEIRDVASKGLIDGVTTNPTLVAKEGREFASLLREICEVARGPVSAEVTTAEAADMIAEGRSLARIHDLVVVKVPLTMPGLEACRTLANDGIKVNVTLCFSPLQAILAAKAGATFVSPFVGRLDDIAESGMDLIEKIVRIYRNYDFDTEVLVASVRNPVHIVDAALLGADICTVPYAVIRQIASHPLTDRGLEKFMADAKKIPAEAKAPMTVGR